jgi:hypothetical protein
MMKLKTMRNGDTQSNTQIAPVTIEICREYQPAHVEAGTAKRTPRGQAEDTNKN